MLTDDCGQYRKSGKAHRILLLEVNDEKVRAEIEKIYTEQDKMDQAPPMMNGCRITVLG